jgi:hypothetical protein
MSVEPNERDALQVDQRHAAAWALANDENFRHLLVWRRMKARAEAGGFTGVLIGDYRAADQALAHLVEDAGR